MRVVRIGLFVTAISVGCIAGMLGLLDVVIAARDAHLNADLLFIADLSRDLLGAPATVGGWKLPPPPYLVPDLLLFTALDFLVRDLGATYVIYEVVMFFLTLTAFYWLSRSAGIPPRRGAIAVGLAALLFLAAMRNAPAQLVVMFLPGYHGGTTLLGVFTLALTLQALGRGLSRRTATTLVLLVASATASDLFFVTLFVLPLVIALLLAARTNQVSPLDARRLVLLLLGAPPAGICGLKLLLLGVPLHFRGNPALLIVDQLPLWIFALGLVALAVVAAIAWGATASGDRRRELRGTPGRRHLLALTGITTISLGAMLTTIATRDERLMSRIRQELPIPADWPAANLHRFGEDLWNIVPQATLLACSTLICIFGCVVLLDSMRTRRAARRSTVATRATRTTDRVIATFFLVSVAGMLVEGGLTWVGLGNRVPPLGVINEGTVRHVQPLFVLPVFLIAIAIARSPLSAAARNGLIAFVLVFSTIKLVHPPITLDIARLNAPYEPAVRCLDELVTSRHLHSGYGDYWTGRHLSMLSRRSVQVVPLRLRTYEIEDWMSNPRRFFDRTREPGGRTGRFDFFVTSRFSTSKTILHFGPPASIERCGPMEILLYDDPGKSRLPDLPRDANLTSLVLPIPG